METMVEARPFYCEAVVFAGNRYEPAEYCENEVDADGDLCASHGDFEDGYDDQDYWIERDAENDAYDDWI